MGMFYAFPMMNNQHFGTFDLNLSAVLIAYGFALQDVEKTGRKARFIFSSSDTLHEVIDKYWRQELTVNPHTLFNSLKLLKNRLYSDC